MVAPTLLTTRSLGCVLCLLFILTSTASAQDGGAADGITVHGHWVIDVRNADGTLASHNVFENELLRTTLPNVRGGGELLATLIGGLIAQSGPPVWDVIFAQSGGFPASQPVGGPACPLSPCHVRNGLPGAALSVSIPTNAKGDAASPAVVRLSGHLTATSSGAIQYVESVYNIVSTNPNGEEVFTTFRFTGRTLPAPLQVAQGQIVQFSVEFTFS